MKYLSFECHHRELEGNLNKYPEWELFGVIPLTLNSPPDWRQAPQEVERVRVVMVKGEKDDLAGSST